MKSIVSRQNTEIKAIDALKNPKGRREQGRFVAEGLRTVETLASAFTPLQIYVTEAFYAMHAMPVRKELITLVAQSVMEKISSSGTPAGILGVFAIPKQPAQPLAPGLVLVDVTNPGNMGTLIRTAAAMGKKTVVLVSGTDVWSPKVVQATAGALAFVDIYCLSREELIAKKGSLPLCALIVRGGSSPEELDLRNALIVVGNEAQGLSGEWIAACEQRCTLSMPGNTESLNAAIAGSIALYLAR